MSRVQPHTEFDPARIVETHQRGVWRYLRALGCEAELAEDLLQETFLAVLQRPFADYHPAATGAYLRRVARNLFVSHRRRTTGILTTSNLDDVVDADWVRWAQNDEGESLLAALRECLARLAERTRRALDLRYRDRQSRAQIAAAVGLSEDGAKNLMQRAKKTLRECIERTLG